MRMLDLSCAETVSPVDSTVMIITPKIERNNMLIPA